MVIPWCPFVTVVMAVVSAVHEEVDKRAKQQHRVGKHAQNVRSMFFP
jgi:hypothetical protein